MCPYDLSFDMYTNDPNQSDSTFQNEYICFTNVALESVVVQAVGGAFAYIIIKTLWEKINDKKTLHISPDLGLKRPLG